MSVRIMSLVWDKFPSGGSEMLVLLAMADWCNDNGLSLHPSNEAVAEKCRISKVQAQRIIKSLTDDGWLAVIGNKFGGAPGSTKQYRLCIERFDGYQKDTGITGDTGIANDTGITRRKRRVSPSAETGITGDTQTTIEPPIEPPINPAQEKPARFDPLSVSLPSAVKGESWKAWIAYRRSRRLTCTQATILSQLESLHAWAKSGHDPQAIIATSIGNGWQGLFEPKRQQQAPPSRQANRDSYDAQARAAQDRLNMGERHDNSTEHDITGICTRVA